MNEVASKQSVLNNLRKIAPSLTWKVADGQSLMDYGTKAFPWGRMVPAVIVSGGNAKGRKTPEHGKQWQLASEYLSNAGMMLTGGNGIAAIRKL